MPESRVLAEQAAPRDHRLPQRQAASSASARPHIEGDKVMTLTNTFRFLSVLLTAVAMAAGLAHLFALPNKIDLPRADYLTVQQIYRGWALLGITVIGALVSTLVLTILVRESWKQSRSSSSSNSHFGDDSLE
jgi:hypothetical protein